MPADNLIDLKQAGRVVYCCVDVRIHDGPTESHSGSLARKIRRDWTASDR